MSIGNGMGPFLDLLGSQKINLQAVFQQRVPELSFSGNGEEQTAAFASNDQ
jgi:hypothetical protein